MIRRPFRYVVAAGLASTAIVLTPAALSAASASTAPDDTTPATSAPTSDGGGGGVGLDCAAFADAEDAPADVATFVELAVQSNGVFRQSLDQPGTVLIPVESAFDAVPENVLTSITADPALLSSVIDYHYLPGEALSAEQLLERGEVSTGISGTVLTFADDGGTVTINGGEATVLCADINQDGMIYHLVDTVLQPPAGSTGAPGSSVPGSSVPSNSTPGNSVPDSSVPAFGPDEQAVADAWETVTDSSLGADEQAPLIEDADEVAETIENYPAAADVVRGIRTEVRTVTIDGDTAAITYVLLFDGAEAPYGELEAELIQVDGEWIVGREQYCQFQDQARNLCPLPGAARESTTESTPESATTSAPGTTG